MASKKSDKSEKLGEQAAQVLGQLLVRANRSNIYDQLTEGLDDALDASTYPILSGLERIGPATASQLSTRVGLDRSVVSRHASRLESAGLLRRAADPNDARSTLMLLTPKGSRLIRKTRQRMATLLGDYLSTWPESDATTFVVLLERFVTDAPVLHPA